MTTAALAPSTEAVVRRVWADRLRVPAEALEAPGAVLVERPDLTAAVLVRLGRTVAVAAPPDALTDVRRLSPDGLLDVAALLDALRAHGPDLLGAAALSYADAGTASSPRPGDVRAAAEAEVEAVLSRCSVDERDESGLADMTVRLVATDRAGWPAAVAGYEVWDDALAHLGLAVALAHRAEGWGATVASAAAHRAIGAGLVPQWRCSVDNVASARVRDRLGFVQLGEQITIDLAPARRGVAAADARARTT